MSASALDGEAVAAVPVDGDAVAVPDAIVAEGVDAGLGVLGTVDGGAAVLVLETAADVALLVLLVVPLFAPPHAAPTTSSVASTLSENANPRLTPTIRGPPFRFITRGANSDLGPPGRLTARRLAVQQD